jgi:hypothetical protein
MEAILNSRVIPARQFGADDPIASEGLEVQAAARGGEACRHWFVSAMKPSGNEFLAFGEELLNQEIEERIFSNGRRDPGEQAEVAKSVSVSEQLH